MDGVINVRVNGYSIVKDHNCAGAQYESGSTKLRIEFGDDWDGFAKKVTFWNSLGQNPTVGVITPAKAEDLIENARVVLVPIPGEVMTEAGMITFVVDGYHNGVLKRSVEDKLKVLPSRKEDNPDNAKEPTPDDVTQILEDIEAMRGDIQKAYIAEEKAAEYADNAIGAASSASLSADSAFQSATDAKNEANRAESAVGKASYIGANGNWYVWDVVSGEYVDTGVSATGNVRVTGSSGDTVDVTVEEDEASGTFRVNASVVDYSIQGKHIGNHTIDERNLQPDSVGGTQIKAGVVGKYHVNDEVVTEDDMATTDKAGIVKIFKDGGLQLLSNYLPNEYLAINEATPIQIKGKSDFFHPITPEMFDLALAEGTHQKISAEYDPSSLYTCFDMDGKQGQLPVSYDAVKAYVDGNNVKTVSFFDSEIITVEDNTNYIAQEEISSLTIFSPDADFICSFQFTLVSEGDITITLPESKYIGGVPEFANGETWELNIKNGVVVGGKVE